MGPEVKAEGRVAMRVVRPVEVGGGPKTSPDKLRVGSGGGARGALALLVVMIEPAEGSMVSVGHQEVVPRGWSVIFKPREKSKLLLLIEAGAALNRYLHFSPQSHRLPTKRKERKPPCDVQG